MSLINSSVPIEFGVLLPHAYQWLDATGPVDYLNSNTQAFMTGAAGFAHLPEAFIKKAPIINWHYISATGDLQPVEATSGPPLTPTKNFTSAPQLDYLLIPGPDPFLQLSGEATRWIQNQYTGLKGLLSVCTGGLFLTQTGLLDGVNAATNKYALKTIAQGPDYGKFNKVNWVPDARFVVDGKIWTAAGVTSGLDLAAAFARAHFDPEVVKFGEEALEYVPNPDRPDPFAYILEGVEL